MNKAKYRGLVLVLGVFFFTFNTSAQVSSAQIDSLVSLVMKKFNVAGLAVGVVQDGKIIHSKGY